MPNVTVPLPELGAIAVTRVALGVGIGLLISSYFSREQRQQAGWTLVALGLSSTVPLAMDVYRRN
jgi:hypothetical protein